MPPATSRRLTSATASRIAPDAERHRQPRASPRATSAARPGLLDDAGGGRRVGAVHLDGRRCRAVHELVDRALPDDAARDRRSPPRRTCARPRRGGATTASRSGPRATRLWIIDPHLVHAGWVEPVHRLVQDEQLRVTEQA